VSDTLNIGIVLLSVARAFGLGLVPGLHSQQKAHWQDAIYRVFGFLFGFRGRAPSNPSVLELVLALDMTYINCALENVQGHIRCEPSLPVNVYYANVHR
jgi:hypothetical protein